MKKAGGRDKIPDRSSPRLPPFRFTAPDAGTLDSRLSAVLSADSASDDYHLQ
jgi:hypothetical protein